MSLTNYDDRLIMVSRIEPNPRRDFDIYPIHVDKIEQLEDSYRDGDFGTIIPVRPHPRKEGFYQQACGHHRVAAMRSEGKPLKILCRVMHLEDWEMSSIMVRENMNNYGNNPEAVADSVAAICKQLIYWMFLSSNVDDFSGISEKCHGIFSDSKEYDSAKGRLVTNNQIGEPLITRFFTQGKMMVDRAPMSKRQVSMGLASLNATGKMLEICGQERARAERKLAADRKDEIRRAEEAERKAKEAAEALAAWNKREEERRARLKEEREEAKRIKDELARKQAEARLAKEKADADRERKRMRALEIERQKQAEIAEKQRKLQAETEAAQAKAAKAKENAAESKVDPWLHTQVFGMFENMGQFDAFRQEMSKPEYQRLFPRDQQPAIITAMLEQLRATDDLTARGIKAWMLEQDERGKKEAERKRKAAEKLAQEQRERNSKAAKVDRVMTEFQSHLSKLSLSFEEVHKLMQEPEMADLVLQHPYSETLRPSVERLYKVLPEIEKLFGMMARQVRDDNNPVREERVING